MKFLIFHGTLGSPDGNWFPWLAQQLEKLGHSAVRPQLPTPNGQTPGNWLKIIGESVERESLTGEDLVIVAHSSSPLAACQYLQTRNSPIKVCFFVAGFAKRLPGTEEPFPALNNPFADLGADWQKVRENCHKFVCFGGDNDPYASMDILQDFAGRLKTELIVIKNGGHLNAEFGFTKFPQLLEKINEVIPLDKR